MRAMPDTETPESILAEIEADQAKLRQLLAGLPDVSAATRPRTDTWSVVENLRHLLAAEELHLGQFVPGPRAYSAIGLPPAGLRKRPEFAGLHEAASPSIPEVMEEWEAAHATIRPYLTGDGEKLSYALWKNRRHLRGHIEVIERLLRKDARARANAGR
jgi:hypothetical protein